MRRSTWMILALLLIAAVSLGVIGCGDDTTTTPATTTPTTTTTTTPTTTTTTPTTATTTTTARAPTVRITSPAAGASVPAGSVTVNIEVSNFEIIPAGGANAPNQGHVHYYLDVTIPTTQGQPAVTAPGTYQAVPQTSATWEGVTAGSHTLGVQLVNNNHTPLNPPVTATVTVTVAAGTTTTTTTTPTTTTTTTTPTTTTTTTTTTTAPGGAPAIPASHVGRSTCFVCHEGGIAGAPLLPDSPPHSGFTDAVATCQACHQGP